ncbi:hypothetical protein L2E82_49860 [Cichorium intybus]|uniref:Uncharacterized protein n=1 Tax=Cichorium intybus TaxID=13427 RepID=A0ACB8Z1J2_CICIN|nr:hypothetical protein L2E82_49860 [Cichorium intybus]
MAFKGSLLKAEEGGFRVTDCSGCRRHHRWRSISNPFETHQRSIDSAVRDSSGTKSGESRSRFIRWRIDMKSFKEGRSRWHQYTPLSFFSVSVASCSIYTIVVLQAKNSISGSDGKNGVAPPSSFSACV